MAKKESKKDKKSSMSKSEKIAELEKKIKLIEKTMFEHTSQLSDRNSALARKLNSKQEREKVASPQE
ncbi:MAG: hypothetical protein HQL67_07025 [Magnetococcales bacterium]|nr:hypothetical protein [Magnetococcales bacterium]